MAIIYTVHDHMMWGIKWGLKNAGADDVRVFECHISGEDTIEVKVGETQFRTTFSEGTLQDVSPATIKRIQELKTINAVKTRLKG